MDMIMSGYEKVLHFVAEITVHTLELIGILIIIIGAIKAIVHLFPILKTTIKPISLLILAKHSHLPSNSKWARKSSIL